LLENIQTFFGVGKIYKHTQNSYLYKVQSIKDLQVIIVHFDKYPLISQKRATGNGQRATGNGQRATG